MNNIKWWFAKIIANNKLKRVIIIFLFSCIIFIAINTSFAADGNNSNLNSTGSVNNSVYPATNQVDQSVNKYTIDQTISDGAQRTTLAFSGLAIMTGNLEAQSFFPPGKVADYFGFQYLRDNDPDNMGHNTSFLTRIANNMIYILNETQLNQLETLAINQQDEINLYAYKRYSLMKAFKRLLEGDIPDGSDGLNLDAIKQVSRDLYILDGQISFERALVYANIIKSLDSNQKAYIDNMKGNGWNSWPDITSDQIKIKMQGLPQGTAVSVMTYASDIFSWYVGSVEADVYFCPERHGTYYGSFYIKDAPAIGHEGYSIDEQLTATAGAALCDSNKGYVTNYQASMISSLIDIQRNNLYAGTVNIVQVRTQIATLLRSLMISTTSSDTIKTQVLELSGIYGDLDGENNYNYATLFAQVYQSLTTTQKENLTALRKSIMSGTYADGTPFDYSTCTTPYLYSSIITDKTVLEQYISNTDYLFNNQAPYIISSSPISDAINVSLTTPVTITFSENILAGANFAGIYIKNLTSGSTVTLASKTISGNVLTLTQSLSRIANNSYQVYIPAGVVKDAAGNSLGSSYSFTFKTTGGTTDTTKPTVTSTEPANSATGVSLTTPVTITFSENILAGTYFSSIYIKNLTSGSTVTLASKSISGNTLTITQSLSRIANNSYQVYIPAGAVKDMAGNSLGSSYSFTFKTAGGTTDTTKPTVTSTSPVNGATGVSLTSPVTITFSENILAGTYFSSIYIKNLTTGSTVTLASKTISGNVLTLTQSLSRLANNSYQVYIPAGAVKDAAGNSLGSSYTTNFQTTGGTSTDTTSPTITSTSPVNGATGVSLTSSVTINFSENIQAGTNFSGIYIKNLTTGKIVGLSSKTISGNKLIIKQSLSRLSKNSYLVYIPVGAVKDAAGNSLKTSYSFGFKTV
jgi:methionine-rich copper-binding protein CopC